MTREEFKTFVKGIQALYGREDKLVIDSQIKFDLWYSLLSDLEYKNACKALENFAKLSAYEPKPANIRDEYFKIVERGSSELSEMEAWALVRRAIRNGIYGSEEEFAKFPTQVQKAVGNPEALTQWAMTETKEVETVIMSQFLKTYRTIIERSKETARLSAGDTKNIGMDICLALSQKLQNTQN